MDLDLLPRRGVIFQKELICKLIFAQQLFVELPEKCKIQIMPDAGVKKLVRDLSVTLRQVILREIF